MKMSLAAVLCVSLVVPACNKGDGQSADLAAARRFAHETIIVDTHVDVPYRLVEKWEDISERTTDGEFDYVRAREGGLDAPFMSIYLPAETERQGRAHTLADSLIDMVEEIAQAHPDKFAVAVSPEDIERNFNRGVVSLCLGMENGAPIAGDLANVEYFYNRGIRYITLTHGRDNHICDSSYDTTRTWHGLSDFGREVVREMNRVGVMVDVSHVSDDAFWQVMDVTTAPVIASHSSCRYFVPGFERNMSDDMIRRVAAGGGVVQVNFGSTFLTQTARRWLDAYKEARSRHYEENNIVRNDTEDLAYFEVYTVDHPFPSADVAAVADHIDHIVELVGIDHVGFGSDFDGVGPTLPVGLEDVSHYPDLILELKRRGYSDEDVAKIAHGNIFRVWRAVAGVASRQ